MRSPASTTSLLAAAGGSSGDGGGSGTRTRDGVVRSYGSSDGLYRELVKTTVPTSTPSSSSSSSPSSASSLLSSLHRRSLASLGLAGGSGAENNVSDRERPAVGGDHAAIEESMHSHRHQLGEQEREQEDDDLLSGPYSHQQQESVIVRPTEFLLLDFSAVLGIDATSARSCFLMLVQLMRASGVKVVFGSHPYIYIPY